MRIAILTGDELRHRYFRTRLSNDSRFSVALSVCEGTEQSLANRVSADESLGPYALAHVAARTRSEHDFFSSAVSKSGNGTDFLVPKGSVNTDHVVARIIAAAPDLLICYGSSLIRSELLDMFRGRFLNVHLGLSPYYRGSGTNVWPMVNGELDLIGATFMHIDAGIDTGEIIHQIRADIYLGDGPHSIGNRLIAKMTAAYAHLIASWDQIAPMEQLQAAGRLYKQRDWTEDSTRLLYARFRDGLVENYVLNGPDRPSLPIIVNGALA